MPVVATRRKSPDAKELTMPTKTSGAMLILAVVAAVGLDSVASAQQVGGAGEERGQSFLRSVGLLPNKLCPQIPTLEIDIE